MKLAALVSGGKDSLCAMYLMHKQGHEIAYIISVSPENPESYMFHYPNTWISEKQAEAMDIPLIKISTKGEKEKELIDLENALSKIKDEIDGVVSGALASEYQKSRIDNVCKKLALKNLAPLWHINPEKYWNGLLDDNFKVMITAVAAQGLDKSWLGRIIDRKSLQELKNLSEKHKFHFSGEGGEFETLVLDMPLFKKRIKVADSEIIWESDSGRLVIKKVTLVRKQ